MWKQRKNRSQHKIGLVGLCTGQCTILSYLLFKVRNILFRCRRALFSAQGSPNPAPAASPALLWEFGPSRQVAAAVPLVNLAAMQSLWRAANVLLLGTGQEKGRAWRKDCTSKPTGVFGSVGTIGGLDLVLAGWRGALDSNRICTRWQKAVQELLLV